MNTLPQQPEPRVFDELAKVARIRELPYPFPKVIRNVTFITTVREEFEREITVALATAHTGATIIYGSKKLMRTRIIAREAKALADTLGRLRAEEKNILAFFLPHRRSEAFDDFVLFTRELAKCANDIMRLGKAPKLPRGLRLFRQTLVSALLDAAATAGGNLTLNKRSGRGSLVEALDLLKPYLPPEISQHLSFSTLGHTPQYVGQKPQRKSLKAPRF